MRHDTIQFARATVALRTSGAQAVMKQFLELPNGLSTDPCNQEHGIEFLLAVEPTQGPRVVMKLQLYGCRLVGVSGSQRVGADAVLASFQRELARQRATSGPPEEPFRPGSWCGRSGPSLPSVMPPNLPDAVAGRACDYAGVEFPEDPDREIQLTEAQLP